MVVKPDHQRHVLQNWHVLQNCFFWPWVELEHVCWHDSLPNSSDCSLDYCDIYYNVCFISLLFYLISIRIMIIKKPFAHLLKSFQRRLWSCYNDVKGKSFLMNLTRIKYRYGIQWALKPISNLEYAFTSLQRKCRYLCLIIL